jgi:signal transduction histidine kinase
MIFRKPFHIFADQKIHIKIAIVLTFTVMLIMSAIGFLFFHNYRSRFTEERLLKIKIISHNLKRISTDYLLAHQEEWLPSLYQFYIENDKELIYVVFHLNGMDRQAQYYVSAQELASAISSKDKEYLRVKHMGDAAVVGMPFDQGDIRDIRLGDQYLEILQPIYIENVNVGYLRIGFTDRFFLDDLKKNFLQMSGLSFAGILLIVMLIFSAIKHMVLNPLREVVQMLQEVSEDEPIPEKDIGYLSRTFSKMVKSIKTARHRLQDYANNLEHKVKERTVQLEEAHQRIMKLEKEAVEKQMAGGFAHEMRNALSGAKLLLEKSLGADKDPRMSMCLENSYQLRDIFMELQKSMRPEDLHKVLTQIKSINANDAKLEHILELVDKSLSRGLKITKQIMEFAKIGEIVSGKESIKIEETIAKIVDECRDEFALQGIKIKLDIHGSLILMGDAEHFFFIFKNIINNARDALLECKNLQERLITIATKDEVDIYTIRISDNGPGIPLELHGKIFQAFFSTKPEKGAGLGLGMVQKYVHLYQGRIQFESPKGQGTTFVLIFKKQEEYTRVGT